MPLKLSAPFMISSRLLPAVCIGNATISIAEHGRSADNRPRYRYWIDRPNLPTYESADLSGGVGAPHNVREGMESLISFLGACAESVAYGERSGRPGENADLFPPEIGAWAAEHADDLAMMECDIQENPECAVRE